MAQAYTAITHSNSIAFEFGNIIKMNLLITSNITK